MIINIKIIHILNTKIKTFNPLRLGLFNETIINGFFLFAISIYRLITFEKIH